MYIICIDFVPCPVVDLFSANQMPNQVTKKLYFLAHYINNNGHEMPNYDQLTSQFTQCVHCCKLHDELQYC